MFYTKNGAPEESDLVLCTITKIQYHSVFAKLDEYSNKSGMIHISEISPGRIRNIFDFVKEGKVVVCKVLKIHPKLGHIDLSLRRVSEGQRRMKMDEIKQEVLAEKIVELLATKLGKENKKVYDEISGHVLKDYEYLHDCFLESINDESVLEKQGIPKEYIPELLEIIKLRNKPKEIQKKEDLTITSYAPDGVEIIKKALKNVEKISDSINITYNGGGNYNITITDIDFKEAEKTLKKTNEAIEKSFCKTDCIVEIKKATSSN
ncbi:S1 RNA-binding domain-containing protein [Candidatus Woesearchaeota archaeon]|nr:S1 RNA-binding domain-containing protein [Candidatus Woesearchaeota archaeon]